jgi:hypothetical protein
MKTISTTNARKNIKALLEAVKETGEVFAIKNHNSIEVLIIKFPSDYSRKLSEITNINSYSSSFDFLADEPDLYSLESLKVRYE